MKRTKQRMVRYLTRAHFVLPRILPGGFSEDAQASSARYREGRSAQLSDTRSPGNQWRRQGRKERQLYVFTADAQQ